MRMACFADPVHALSPKKSASKPAAPRPQRRRIPPAQRPALWHALQLKAAANAQAGPAPAPRTPSRSGLPERLRAGVERLSGFFMGDVRVHRDSAEPARLGALAFTQGSDIHLGPGQEQHLPHEAWHVVQQKEGRVAATAQMKGQGINDDAGLEREADAMGAAALRAAPAGPLAPEPPAPGRTPAAGAGLPVQRKALVYKDGSTLGTKNKGILDSIAGTLDKSVGTAVGMIRGNPKLSGYQGNGYTAAWVTTFNALLETKKIPEFFYARYGYAVETIASALMPSTFGNLAIQTQYAVGATRPDFVVWADKTDVAWLDITSSGSAGHIRAKQHSGWSSRPYVAEILYDPPNVSDFSSGKDLSEEHKKAFAQIATKQAEEEIDYQTGHDALADILEQALISAANSSKTGQIGKTATKAAVTATLKGVFSNMTASCAGEVLRCIQNLIVGKESHSGNKWANWAFGSGGYALGRAFIIAYGKNKREKASSSTTTTSSTASTATASAATTTTPTTTTTTDSKDEKSKSKDTKDQKSDSMDVEKK